jgi:hypothetical protein
MQYGGVTASGWTKKDRPAESLCSLRTGGRGYAYTRAGLLGSGLGSPRARAELRVPGCLQAEGLHLSRRRWSARLRSTPWRLGLAPPRRSASKGKCSARRGHATGGHRPSA